MIDPWRSASGRYIRWRVIERDLNRHASEWRRWPNQPVRVVETIKNEIKFDRLRLVGELEYDWNNTYVRDGQTYGDIMLRVVVA